MQAVVDEEPAPPQHAGPLGPVITALLHKDPAVRPGAEEAEQMLAEAVEGVGRVRRRRMCRRNSTWTRAPWGWARSGWRPMGRRPRGRDRTAPRPTDRAGTRRRRTGPWRTDRARTGRRRRFTRRCPGPWARAPAPGRVRETAPRSYDRPRRRTRRPDRRWRRRGHALCERRTDRRHPQQCLARHRASRHHQAREHPDRDFGLPGAVRRRARHLGAAGRRRGLHHLLPDKTWQRQANGNQVDYTPDGGKHFVRIAIDDSPDFPLRTHTSWTWNSS